MQNPLTPLWVSHFSVKLSVNGNCRWWMGKRHYIHYPKERVLEHCNLRYRFQRDHPEVSTGCETSCPGQNDHRRIAKLLLKNGINAPWTRPNFGCRVDLMSEGGCLWGWMVSGIHLICLGVPAFAWFSWVKIETCRGCICFAHIMYRIGIGIVAHPATTPATNLALHTHNKQTSVCLRKDVPEVNDQNLAGNTPLHYCFQCAWQGWSWPLKIRWVLWAWRGKTLKSLNMRYNFLHLSDYLISHGADVPWTVIHDAWYLDSLT